jgi:hypothetical protein
MRNLFQPLMDPQKEGSPANSLEAAAAALATPAAPAPALPTPEEKAKADADAAAKAAPKPDPFAPKFAALTKRERETKAREDAATVRESKIAEREKAVQDPRELAKTSKLAALEAIGLKFEDVAEEVLQKKGSKDKEALTAVEQRLAKMEAEARAREEQEQTDRRAQARQEVMEEIAATVDGAPEKYEFIKESKSYPLVFQVIEQFYATHAKALSYEEACDHVEKYLDDQWTKSMSWKKVQSKIGAKPKEEPPPAGAKPESTKKDTGQTLTSDATATGRAPEPGRAPLRMLTRDAEIEAAAKLLKSVPKAG